MTETSEKPKLHRAYDPVAYARTREVRLARQKAYYQENAQRRLEYQKEYDAAKRAESKKNSTPKRSRAPSRIELS